MYHPTLLGAMTAICYLCHHEVLTFSLVGIIVGTVLGLVIKYCCYQQHIPD